MKITKMIRESGELINWLDDSIHGVEIKSDIRSQLAIGCLEVALEHQKAIVLLISHSLYGSAFALLRLLFEAYVRGVWLHRCAADADLERFKRDKLDKSIATLTQDIEKLDGYDSGVFSKVKDKSWNPMNSYTHSGYLQICRRIKGTTIEPNYVEDEIVEVLNFTNAAGLLSALQIAFLSGSEQLSNSIFEKTKAFLQTIS
jgi:hypothetical protein